MYLNLVHYRPMIIGCFTFMFHTIAITYMIALHIPSMSLNMYRIVSFFGIYYSELILKLLVVNLH